MDYNVLYDPLPEEWEGYKINTWFQTGVQVLLTFEDDSLMPYEKVSIITALLFEDEDEVFGESYIREHPQGADLERCINWFLNGWNHDNHSSENSNQKLMDYFVDQWRIYADFRHFYNINLNDCDLHWWEFCGLLWNMPSDQSAFFQVIDIRRKEITPKMSKQEKQMYTNAKKVYALKQPAKQYTDDQILKIDDFDRRMAEKRKKKKAKDTDTQ